MNDPEDYYDPSRPRQIIHKPVWKPLAPKETIQNRRKNAYYGFDMRLKWWGIMLPDKPAIPRNVWMYKPRPRTLVEVHEGGNEIHRPNTVTLVNNLPNLIPLHRFGVISKLVRINGTLFIDMIQEAISTAGRPWDAPKMVRMPVRTGWNSFMKIMMFETNCEVRDRIMYEGHGIPPVIET